MTDERPDEIRGRLGKLLRELFQSDMADVDTGIHAIMNHKRDRIEAFIERDLIKRTEELLAEYSLKVAQPLNDDLQKLAQEIRRDIGPETITEDGIVKMHADLPKVKDYLRKQEDLRKVEEGKISADEVYSHVYEFFSRYYDRGDFISTRMVGGRKKYVIPYNGEEVLLHWANKDQYYVKTGEYFQNYGFIAGGWRIRFVLTHADVDPDNVKGDKRYFLLAPKPAVEKDDKKREMRIMVQYRGLTEKEAEAYGKRNTQEAIVEESVKYVLSRIAGTELERLLSAKVKRNGSSDNDGDEISLFMKHFYRYVTKNTTEYFIHKDLKGFLERELDIYIKSEVLHLDDIERLEPDAVRREMTRAKTLRAICETIIEFLAQIEDFQKMLYNKKKFIIDNQYSITVDRILNIEDKYTREWLLNQIIKNEAQYNEWVQLLAINDISPTLDHTGGKKPLTLEFLKANPYLMVDTKHFNDEFKDQLLVANELLHDKIDGLMIRSENYQALNFLMQVYSGRVKGAYIDPPYNTGSDGFNYKDSYQHSTWLSMITDRLGLTKEIVSKDGLVGITIDDNEVYKLGSLMNDIFGISRRLACAPWMSEPSGGKEKGPLRTGHEYVLIYHNGDTTSITHEERSTGELDSDDKWGKYRKGRELNKWGDASLRDDRPDMWFPIKAPDGSDVYPIRNDGKEGRWRWGKKNPQIKAIIDDPENAFWELRPFDEGITYQGKKERWFPFEKVRDEKRSFGWSTWLDSYGYNSDGTRILKNLFGRKTIDTVKPVSLWEWLVSLHGSQDGIFLDFFAGSGTTGHAVINLNSDDDGTRKYILIEMADYFDTVLLPRIKKVVYSKEWKEGKPVSRDTGTSHMFQYFQLESYEDALNNIIFKERDRTVQETLDGFRDHFLRYMLDYETRESPTRLSIKNFETPFDYKIRTVSGGEEKIQTVDLVETFNYLLGIHVEKLRAAKDGDRYYRVVWGRARDERRVFIVWRNTKDMKETDHKKDLAFIENTFLKDQPKPDVIYANGICIVPGARPIEPEFKQLMGA